MASCAHGHGQGRGRICMSYVGQEFGDRDRRCVVALVPMLSTYPVMPDVATKRRTRRLGLILIKIEGGGYAYVTDETFTVLHT